MNSDKRNKRSKRLKKEKNKNKIFKWESDIKNWSVKDTGDGERVFFLKNKKKSQGYSAFTEDQAAKFGIFFEKNK